LAGEIEIEITKVICTWTPVGRC